MRRLLLALPVLVLASLPAWAGEEAPRDGEGGLLGREVLVRLQALRQEYQPRLKTEQGRAAFERQLESFARRLQRSLDKPTGVTDEHLGSLRGLWEATAAFDAALARAQASPSPQSRAALADARKALMMSARLLAALPEALRPDWVRPEGGAGDGPGGGRRLPPGLGAFLLQLGDAMGARQTFDAAVAASPKDSSALAGRASAAFAMGDLASAYGDARRALELDADDRVALAVLKLAEGRGAGTGVPGAPAPGAAAAQPAPASAHAAAVVPTSSAGALEAARWNREALAALRLGDRAAALAAADRALAAYASNPVSHMVRARFFLKDRDYRAALAAAEAGLLLAPEDRTLLSLKARSANRLRDAALAARTAEALVGLEPGDAEGLANLAHARGLSGDRAGMLALLERAAAADGNYETSLQSALAMPPGAAELFLFPGEEPSSAVLAALRQAAAKPAASRCWVFVLAGLAGGLALAVPFFLLRRRS